MNYGIKELGDCEEDTYYFVWMAHNITVIYHDSK